MNLANQNSNKFIHVVVIAQTLKTHHLHKRIKNIVETIKTEQLCTKLTVQQSNTSAFNAHWYMRNKVLR